LRPDVVLMDIAMPKMNGVEATKRIKASCPGTAIIVLTAFDDDVYVFALLEAGAAGYLMKTVRSDELADSIRAVHAGESVLSPSVAAKVMARFSSRKGTTVVVPVGSDRLTSREREVLLLASQGFANKSIAAGLGVSPRTVQMHLAHIFEKLGVASRTEAVVTGLREGWLPLDDQR
jgi:DNA-binding NarL/FixJ family response regulator